MRGNRQFGQWGHASPLFEMWEEANDNPAILAKMGLLTEEDLGALQEGTGAPEGRADFPLFLQGIFHHVIRDRFADVPSKWRSYVGIESAKDFRVHTTSQFDGLVGIGPVPENGEYGRMRSSESQGPPFQVGKFGGIFGITMELVVNDDTDTLLNKLPMEIARVSANYRSQAIVAYIESNPTYIDGTTFFNSSRLNNYTGSAATINEDNLATMVENMQLHRTADGIPFDITPTAIVVRGARAKLRFQQILRSAQTVQQATGVADTVFPRGSDNVLKGILPDDAVITEPWLNDVDDYYILSATDPARSAFIMAFLRGQQEPMVGLKDHGVRLAAGAGTDPYSWEWDTIDYKLRDIFGINMGEPFAAVRGQPT